MLVKEAPGTKWSIIYHRMFMRNYFSTWYEAGLWFNRSWAESIPIVEELLHKLFFTLNTLTIKNLFSCKKWPGHLRVNMLRICNMAFCTFSNAAYAMKFIAFSPKFQVCFQGSNGKYELTVVQVMAWHSQDLCCHMALLGHNELNRKP